MHRIKETEVLEEKLKGMLVSPAFLKIYGEYERVLEILGNVDGPEIVALALIAQQNVTETV